MLTFSMCRTCLHWACKRNHAPVVAYLLHAGADKEILTKKGERPAQLTSKREIRKMLGGKPIQDCSKRLFKACYVPIFILHVKILCLDLSSDSDLISRVFSW